MSTHPEQLTGAPQALVRVPGVAGKWADMPARTPVDEAFNLALDAIEAVAEAARAANDSEGFRLALHTAVDMFTDGGILL
ncbi:hypothetical protein ACFXAZ_12070 [Streptomyces sp. NPDC059477]|uniref:hypothetical protein n=1 Tax=Streptomyces sp. NPDC059477 TaxID=3346847 RepID=UPI00368D751C